MGTGSDLGQVGDGQHLAVLSQLAQQATDRVGHRTTDAGIHFVEDQGRCLPQLAGHHRDGQGDAREFATRCHLAHRTRCDPGMTGHQEFHLFPAVGLRLVQFLQRHLEQPALHAQLLHGRGHGLGQARGAVGALLADAPAFGIKCFEGPPLAGLQGVQVERFVQPGQFGFPLRQERGQFLGQATEAPGQRQPLRQTFIQRLKVRRVQVAVAPVLVQAVDRVLDLGQGRFQRLDR